MENLVIEGIITATSKKQDGDYQQEVATKTVYIKTSEEYAKQLESFGLTKYTSKEDGEEYFIMKFPKVLMVIQDDKAYNRPDLSQITYNERETFNFKTIDDTMLPLNIIKGNHKNNDFFRLQAIMITDENQIELIKPENPFGTGEISEVVNFDDDLSL